MIVARQHATPPVSFALCAFVLVMFSACRGDAEGDTPRKAAAKSGAQTTVSGGEVIIAPPKTPYRVATIASPGSITGTVSLHGAVTPLPPAETGSDSTVCGRSIPDESVFLLGSGLAGALVWLEGVESGKAPSLERRVELETVHCRLVPRVQAAMVGSAVNVIGHESFRQHLRFVVAGDSSPRAAILLTGGEQVIPTELPFKAPGLITVRDTEHAWRSAFIGVFDHPYFAVSTTAGAFTIDSVPPGKYTLHAWHERTGRVTQAVEVAAGAPTKVAVTLEGR